MNDTTQIHDFNPGFGPAVSSVDSGNGFGARVFWTAVVPDDDVEVNPGAGRTEMHVKDLAVLDYYSPTGFAGNISLGPDWQTAAVDATVSFDVVWNEPVTRRVDVKDTANGFAGQFNENQATVTWSARSSSGFQFTSNPGNFSTSVPEVPGVNGVTAPLNFFAQVGAERNGVFFPGGEPVLAAVSPQQPVQQSLTMQQLLPVLQTAIGDWQAAGASAAQVAELKQVQVHITALPSSYLGKEAGRQIWISPNAAGWGWYVAASPAPSRVFPARTGSQAYGQMDLLSVVSHELGHVLGLQDSDNLHDVMGETLTPGVRRLPTASDLLDAGVQPTDATTTRATVHAAGSSLSASTSRSDQDVAAFLAKILTAPLQKAPASADEGNPAPAGGPATFILRPPPLLAAAAKNSATSLLLTPRLPASSTALLDQVFTTVAAKPLDQGFDDLIVPQGG